MAAGLEGHVESRAAGEITGLRQSHHLRMGQPDTVVGPLAHHTTGSIDYDSTHPRIGMGSMVCGELDGPSHVAGIAHSATSHYVVRRSMR
jgi:hypothetical protein